MALGVGRTIGLPVATVVNGACGFIAVAEALAPDALAGGGGVGATTVPAGRSGRGVSSVVDVPLAVAGALVMGGSAESAVDPLAAVVVVAGDPPRDVTNTPIAPAATTPSATNATIFPPPPLFGARSRSARVTIEDDVIAVTGGVAAGAASLRAAAGASSGFEA